MIKEICLLPSPLQTPTCVQPPAKFWIKSWTTCSIDFSSLFIYGFFTKWFFIQTTWSCAPNGNLQGTWRRQMEGRSRPSSQHPLRGNYFWKCFIQMTKLMNSSFSPLFSHNYYLRMWNANGLCQGHFVRISLLHSSFLTLVFSGSDYSEHENGSIWTMQKRVYLPTAAFTSAQAHSGRKQILFFEIGNLLNEYFKISLFVFWKWISAFPYKKEISLVYS